MTISCKCGSNRILSVCGKTDDRCTIDYQDKYRSDYVPSGLNIGAGDYLRFNVCLDCGTIQGKFPVSEELMRQVFEGE